MKCEHPRYFFRREDRNEVSSFSTKSTKITKDFRRTLRAAFQMPYDKPQCRSNPHQSHNHGIDYSSFTVNRDRNYDNYCETRKDNIELKKNESWACDFCRVATFKSFREACDHEENCPFNQQKTMRQNVGSSSTLVCSITKEKKIPRTWRSPYLPSSKFTKNCRMSEDNIKTRLLLSLPSDKESLSDRQCYVRSHFVEIFEASEGDVEARHSKGAQKLVEGQIGLRCMHCLDMFGKQKAERATCYPSSISRIYQTVADMQRFHFEACAGIPNNMKEYYKTLKTTRPRGQGSPQSYWITSAKTVGLVDSKFGIRMNQNKKHLERRSNVQYPSSPQATSSLSSEGSVTDITTVNGTSSTTCSSPNYVLHSQTSLPQLSPESSSYVVRRIPKNNRDPSSDQRASCSDANMLLALRGSM